MRKDVLVPKNTQPIARRTRVALGVGVIAASLLVATAIVGVGFAGGSITAAQYQYGKVTICHHTHSKKHPFHTITISNSAWPAHRAHGDTLGACQGSGTAQGQHGKGHDNGKGHHGHGHGKKGDDGSTTTSTPTTPTTTTSTPPSNQHGNGGDNGNHGNGHGNGGGGDGSSHGHGHK